MIELYDFHDSIFILGDTMVKRSNVQDLYTMSPLVRQFIDFCSELSMDKDLLIDLAGSQYTYNRVTI